MPTFFEGLKRILTGKPVFQPGEDIDGVELNDDPHLPDGQTAPSVTPPPAEAVVNKSGQKIIPLATIVKVENRVSGDYLDISLTVQNNSQIDLEIEEIEILGTSHQTNRVLRPGEMYEFVSVYNGARLTHRNYTDCEVRYQTDGDDSFSAVHNVEFKQEADGTYTISRIRFIPPVKDI